MAVSLNGWPVIFPGGKGLVTRYIPGTNLRITLAADAAPVLLYVLGRVHREVRNLEENNAKGGQDEGGYNFRQARNAKAFSNHASGTAADCNWRIWPQNGSKRSMSDAETRAARRIWADVREVVQWGGNWTRFVDEMHWEIKPGATAHDVRDFCKRMGIREDGVLDSRPVVRVRNLVDGARNEDALIVKRALAAEGVTTAGFVLSSKWGRGASNSYKKWQRKLGILKGKANGVPTVETLEPLGEKHGFRVTR